MSSSSSAYDRIDVHSHFLPPFYRDELARSGHEHPDGMPAIPEWDIATHLALMDRLQIKKSILSISSPGTSLSPPTPNPTNPTTNATDTSTTSAASLTRRTNAYAAALKRQHPDRIGFWASLPLPDVPATLAEIQAATSEGADGFVVLSNSSGSYLGDSALAPVLEALDACSATIFIHPASPCGSAAAPLASRGYPNPIFEFMFETGRAVAHLLLSGAVARYQRLRFVIPHAGGAVPGVLNRVIGFSGLVTGPDGGGGAELTFERVQRVLRERFWFDLAGIVWGVDGGEGAEGGRGLKVKGKGLEENGKTKNASTEAPTNQLQSLLSVCHIPPSHLLYGSDYPFTPSTRVIQLADVMETGLEAMFPRQEVARILRGNAEVLLSETKTRQEGKGGVGDGVSDGVVEVDGA